MSHSLKEVFSEYSDLEVIEFLNFDDQKGNWGFLGDNLRLKILDNSGSPETFHKLPDAALESGHTTSEGYIISGRSDIRFSGIRIFVYRDRKTFQKWTRRN